MSLGRGNNFGNKRNYFGNKRNYFGNKRNYFGNTNNMLAWGAFVAALFVLDCGDDDGVLLAFIAVLFALACGAFVAALFALDCGALVYPD